MSTLTLNEQDKRDLLGWISGLGDASSNVRAQQLLKSNRESIEYVLQMKTITAALKPPADEEFTPELSETETIAITEAVLDRADRIREHRIAGRIRPVRWIAALAACIAIFVLPSIWMLSLRKPMLGEVAFLELGANLQSDGYSESSEKISEGSTIESGDKVAIVSFHSGQRLTLDAMTKLRIDRADRIELQKGAFLAEIPQSLEIRLSGADLKLNSAKATIEKISEGFSCDLTSGHANITISDQNYILKPGQRGLWNQSDKKMSILQLDRARPSRMEAATRPS